MSLHHAQPHKSGASDDYEPLASSLRQIEDNSQVMSARQVTTSAFYDEEARFELLSAYVDDEVTAEERKLVAQWLTDDPVTQQMYQRLLMLRQAIRIAPVPAQPPVQVPTLHRQSWQRLSSWSLHQTLMCAVAIALIVSLSHLGMAGGRHQLQEAWQLIKSIPQEALLEVASTVHDSVTEYSR
ncbi:MAG: anti-sigma factor family protein [Leptolyngbyaceae cyanobacterium]